MQKKVGLLGTFAVVALTLSMSSSGNAAPQARLHSFVSPLQAQAQTQTKQPVQEFQGTIEKSGTKYVLVDKASGARYQLDKQDKARQSVGKDVKITGTLDPSTNTIEVSEIKDERGGE
ncbi:MAG TPA: DUF5818 domain-containing protein [Candidatus Acidoferrales bacterium]|nr:DUF5818 domain-containing protein [Candidatus Acidoferrales bacterium]